LLFFFQPEDGIRDFHVTGVQTCALPICTTTDAGGTPGTPPSRTPRPSCERMRWYAPTCVASRPATSLIGASRGREPSGSSTVSGSEERRVGQEGSWRGTEDPSLHGSPGA